MNSKRFISILATVAFLLCIPLISMQFTNEVTWTVSDFVIAGILLLSTGLVIDLIIRKVKNKNTKIAIVSATVLLLFLVWAELAVGIFNSPIAGS